jgi:hypothetical protein
MCSAFSLNDLFLAGIGFDISGAALVVIGLFKSPRRLSADLKYKGTPGLVHAGSDFIDGAFGLTSLLIGFLLQGLGYTLLPGRESPDSLGLRGTITGLVVLVAAASVPWFAWSLARGRLLRRVYLIRLARYDNMGGEHELPELQDLVTYAEILDEKRRPDEYNDEGTKRYARRVFGVSRFRRDSTMQGETEISPD